MDTLSETEKPSIEDIIKKWKQDNGQVRVSDRGTAYVIMPNSTLLSNLKILAKTMFDSGYSYKEMKDYRVAVKLADICWRENKIVKMSSTEIKKAKMGLVEDWSEVISTYSGIKMSELSDSEKVVPVKTEKPKEKELTKEEILDEIMNPKNRLVSNKKIDRSNDDNLEFLEQLGIEPDNE